LISRNKCRVATTVFLYMVILFTGVIALSTVYGFQYVEGQGGVFITFFGGRLVCGRGSVLVLPKGEEGFAMVRSVNSLKWTPVFTSYKFFSSAPRRYCIVMTAPACLLLILSVLLRLWSRRRRYVFPFCPSCSYDLTSNVSGICPECGEPIPKEVREKLATEPSSSDAKIDTHGSQAVDEQYT